MPFHGRHIRVVSHSTYVLILIAMVELLKFALERQRFDAAAYAIVYGLVKVKKYGKKAGQKGCKTRVLRPRVK